MFFGYVKIATSKKLKIDVFAYMKIATPQQFSKSVFFAYMKIAT